MPSETKTYFSKNAIPLNIAWILRKTILYMLPQDIQVAQLHWLYISPLRLKKISYCIVCFEIHHRPAMLPIVFSKLSFNFSSFSLFLYKNTQDLYLHCTRTVVYTYISLSLLLYLLVLFFILCFSLNHQYL